MMLTRRPGPFDPGPIIARSTEHDSVHAFGCETTRILVPAEATNGACATWMHVSRPGFSPPRHIHEREDEIIHMLDGELRVWCDGTTFTVRRGDTATLPRGLPHSYLVAGPNPAQMMTTVVPGGFERFYAAVASLRFPDDIPDFLDVSAAFGLRFVGRPLAD
jgi:quercetin dioxygenase-like cupin family protein